MLPNLTTNQINELIRESQGRAISYMDEPEWYCGVRRNTFMGRDGVIPDGYGAPGTCAALAYSFCDKCAEYMRTVDSAEYLRGRIEQITAECKREESRKTPRRRLLSSLYRDLRIACTDLENCKRRTAEMIARYFRGYESRLLITS